MVYLLFDLLLFLGLLFILSVGLHMTHTSNDTRMEFRYLHFLKLNPVQAAYGIPGYICPTLQVEVLSYQLKYSRHKNNCQNI